jgi:hypothetical protein
VRVREAAGQGGTVEIDDPTGVDHGLVVATTLEGRLSARPSFQMRPL